MTEQLPNSNVLELRQVSFSYEGSDSPVIDELNLSIGEGEFVAIVGKSGCGKSTLLRLMAGFENPVTGVVNQYFDDSYSFIFQDLLLLPHLRVKDQVVLGDRSGADSSELLKKLELWKLQDRYPRQLSVGQQQRLAVARAVFPKPKVLFADEPFANQDVINRVTLQQQVASLCASNSSVVFVTHDIDEGLFLADRLIVLKENCSGCTEVPITLSRPREIEMLQAKKFSDLRNQVLSLL